MVELPFYTRQVKCSNHLFLIFIAISKLIAIKKVDYILQSNQVPIASTLTVEAMGTFLLNKSDIIIRKITIVKIMTIALLATVLIPIKLVCVKATITASITSTFVYLPNIIDFIHPIVDGFYILNLHTYEFMFQSHHVNGEFF